MIFNLMIFKEIVWIFKGILKDFNRKDLVNCKYFNYIFFFFGFDDVVYLI